MASVETKVGGEKGGVLPDGIALKRKDVQTQCSTARSDAGGAHAYTCATKGGKEKLSRSFSEEEGTVACRGPDQRMKVAGAAADQKCLCASCSGQSKFKEKEVAAA